MTLEELTLDLMKRRISLTTGYNENEERIEHEIQIGSKTGTGTLVEHEGKILLYTRYNIIDEVNSYDDIAEVAFRWYDNYKDREPFQVPDAIWLPYFLEKGWIKIETQKVYKTTK